MDFSSADIPAWENVPTFFVPNKSGKLTWWYDHRSHADMQNWLTGENLTETTHSFSAFNFLMMFICWILAAAGISFKVKKGENKNGVRRENLFQASRLKRKFTVLVDSPSKQFVTAPRSQLWSWGCQRLTSHSQTIASVCVTKYRQLKPSTFILYELIVIQGSSTQIMGHREARIMTGTGRGLRGKAHSSLSDASSWATNGPRVASLPTGFLERLVKETQCSEPWPSHQIPREALTSWGLEVTGLGTQSVKGSGHPTSHLHHIMRGLSELPEAVLVFLMPSAGPGGDQEPICPRDADGGPSYWGLD